MRLLKFADVELSVDRGPKTVSTHAPDAAERVVSDCLDQAASCVRLQLECEWPPQPPSLSSRRRGIGPIKTRDAWAPQTILPKSLSGSNLSRFPQVGERSGGELTSPVSLGNAQDHYRRNVQFSTVDLPSPDLTEGDTSQLIGSESPINTAVNDQYAEFPILFPLQSFSSHHFLAGAGAVLFASDRAVDHAPSLGSNDSQAILFHRTVFAPLKSTRKATSSAHCLFLDLALQNAMSLHFLLAVSHNELALHLGFYRQPPQEAWVHLQHGSRIFLQALNPLAPLNHVGTMLSFLYMYMFWMRHNPLNTRKLQDLSASVLNYVKNYNLDELCADSSPSVPDAVLLSRILTYLYDRDGFCGFFGCGGSFASYVSENVEKRQRIWHLSRSIFTFSDEQTISLRMPGIQGPPKSYILNVYFELIAIHHDINQYSQAAEFQTLEAVRKIKRNLAWIQEGRYNSSSGFNGLFS
ncbi:hypothetical protein PENANT_c001G05307 [Penicillium antarcticum]|uniref:Transcription factor domain-containing protein n=1 Tax=Penicillium antarcticum TaxID=416450 RepID=A0A1V6QNC8_9EURO|nr:hypothetical protein PENANT_c001G05307 [Penicillium antarcticum]